MTTETQISIPDIAAGNAGFVIAQAVLKALLERGIIELGDVAPMIREVVELYRRPAAPGREALNASMADVLENVVAFHESTGRNPG